MEAWRVIAGVLLGAGGLVLVLLTMAQVRDRKGSTHGSVALSGAIAFVVLAIVCLLSLTVLPATLVWGLVVAVAVIVTVLLLTS
jgi:hypothetical protein